MTPEERGRRIVRQVLREHSTDDGPFGDLCRACLDDDRTRQLEAFADLGRTLGVFARNLQAAFDQIHNAYSTTLGAHDLEQIAQTVVRGTGSQETPR